MNKPLARAFGYRRTAVPGQSDHDGESITRQLESLNRTANALGIEIIRQYSDQGASGRTLDRPALQRMIADIESGDYDLDFVMVESPDRLTRRYEDDVWFMNMLERNGLRLICATPPERRSYDN